MKFLNSGELVSAGTDGTLKLWDLNNPPYCKRSFSGHVNEKNFVGLATNGEYLGEFILIEFSLEISIIGFFICGKSLRQ